jgi:hypothetical protein
MGGVEGREGGAVALIDAEQDDSAVLRAEDEAIAAQQRGEQQAESIPTGQALADLISELSNDATPVHQG